MNKSNQYKLILLLGIVIVGAITNPSFEDHKREIKKIVNRNMKVESENPFEFLGQSLGLKMIEGFLDNVINVNNYILFSIGTIEYQGNEKKITFGTFGNIFTLSKLEKNKSTNYSLNNDYKILEQPVKNYSNKSNSKKITPHNYTFKSEKDTKPYYGARLYDNHDYLIQGKFQNKGRLGFYFTNLTGREIEEVKFRIIWLRSGERSKDIKEITFSDVGIGQVGETEIKGGAFNIIIEPIIEKSKNGTILNKYKYDLEGKKYSKENYFDGKLLTIDRYLASGDLIYTRNCEEVSCE